MISYLVEGLALARNLFEDHLRAPVGAINVTALSVSR
jgi:hypothetical protein